MEKENGTCAQAENQSANQLVRVLGLKESISMTIGMGVGVGLFTCGSA